MVVDPGVGLVGIPDPQAGEEPTAYAHRVGRSLIDALPAEHRRRLGIYPTPPAAADFMASLIGVPGESVRLLDPGAGLGILACAACERLARMASRPLVIELETFEVDTLLAPSLERVLAYLTYFLAERGVSVSAVVRDEDFVLRHASALMRGARCLPLGDEDTEFDLIIANPPYFKLSKADPRARAAAAVVHGQPNIYGLFMAIGAALLRNGGEFVYITPRSFASGPYFRRFRAEFLNTLRPEQVHVFESRTDAFHRDQVLQENIILKAVRDDGWMTRHKWGAVRVSASRGISDLAGARQLSVPLDVAVGKASQDWVFRLPTTEDEIAVVEFVDAWPETLHSLGLEISTGPVVPFRAVHLLASHGHVPSSHAPLVWMQHVHPMSVTWPNGGRKEEYLALADGSGSLLVADRTYVLVRRFSAKEQARRLTAAPLVVGQLGSPVVGLENHLNYLHRPGGHLSEEEAWGLAALYNSALMDTYFRVLNGNTQVSATELRSIPLPSRDALIEIGRRVRADRVQGDALDAFVQEAVGFDAKVVMGG